MSSLENELEIAMGKVDSLTRDLINRRILTESGADLFQILEDNEEKKKGLENDLTVAQGKIEASNEELIALQAKYESQEAELENVKDALALAQTSLAKLSGSVESEVTLKELQQIWKTLGVDKERRNTIREQIKSCVSLTCQRYLDEACKLKTDTEEELLTLRAKKESMQAALGLPQQGAIEGLGMLDEAKILREQVERLEASYDSANVRRERIISDMISLSSALKISKRELPESLHNMMQQIEKVHACSTSIGRLRRATMMENVQAMVDSLTNKLDSENETTLPVGFPRQESDQLPGSLEESFLARCEDELAELRVRKSEMLVKNRDSMHKINCLIKDLHSNISEVVDLVEKALKGREKGTPIWWNSDEASIVIKRMTASSPRADGEALETRYLEVIYEALSKVAETRRSLSTLLQNIVEKAQQKLLDIVGREVDASEAYASFHDALLKLPSLSVHFSHACITEMEALTVGVEAMMQSEIEALTVVWEALKVSSEERRAFWGRIDDSNETTRIGNENIFGTLDMCLGGYTEEWILSLVVKGRNVNKDLEIKLGKLGAIHAEVEKLRSKQDTKSQVLSLDSEIRILNARLMDFEDLQCNKQRLLTKKSGSTALLKEARFRKQMKSKFVSKLGQLASLLRSWEQEEGRSFDASLLSDDVRMLLNEPDKMETWIERRTKLMPSRTVPAATPRKRSIEEEQKQSCIPHSSKVPSRPTSVSTPPRKKLATSTMQSQVKSTKGTNTETSQVVGTTRSPFRKRKPVSVPSENAPPTKGDVSEVKSPVRKRASKMRKESAALPPFGRILSENVSPDPKGSRT